MKLHSPFGLRQLKTYLGSYVSDGAPELVRSARIRPAFTALS